VKALTIAAIWIAHLLSLAVAVYIIRTGDVAVIVLLYAYMLEYVLRLATIPMLYHVPAVARFVTRRPHHNQETHPVRQGEGGPPAGVGSYLLAIGVFAGFAFALAHVNADRRIELGALDPPRDFAWAMLIAFLYWANGLITRTTFIDRGKPLAINLGYNSKEVTVLALSVLTGTVIVVYRQNADLPPSAWTVMGPLLGYRFLFDLWASLDTVPED
jgi:hypothetical protein